MMRLRPRRIPLFFGVFMMYARTLLVTVRLKPIDGRTGRPVKNEKIGLKDRTDYHDVSVRTTDLGVASLQIRKDAVILVHNTDQYVNCRRMRWTRAQCFQSRKNTCEWYSSGDTTA